MNNADQALSRATEAHREGRYEEANVLIIECLESAGNIRDGECLANGLLLFADNLLCHCPEGDDPFEGRRVAAQEALRLFRELGDRRGESRALLILASVDFEHGDELANEGLGVAREIGDKPLMAKAMNWIANSLYVSGKKQEGVNLASDAVQIARECNDAELLSRTLFTLGYLTDDVPVRIAAFEEMSRVPERRSGFGQRMCMAASLLVDDGEFERAEDLWQRSLAIARELGDVELEGGVLRGQAQLLRARGGDEAKIEELEAMANALGGPVPDLTEFVKATEAGDTRNMLAKVKALLGGR